ncbi:hypothetical protein ASE69_07690 [Sphingomonas sp. Leaf208]|uniref:hypothetical protein n=1 Tax=Sphingomonas sp. Leaf208 TaxID=1735679 RepID=UPI0006FD7CB7|nr:hypothetical protein [Sphingomonas sp. Leaf208]KQM51189.1 hypothetical protein ASE69_07690 [Sphingomonas sp. Leaf208]
MLYQLILEQPKPAWQIYVGQGEPKTAHFIFLDMSFGKCDQIKMSDDQLIRGVSALRSFREAIASRVTSWEPMLQLRGSVRNDRASLVALDSLIYKIVESGLSSIQELFAGNVPLSDLSFGLDVNIVDDDEPYFRVGLEGVDAESARVRENQDGIWMMSDRWGDSIIVALNPNLSLKAAEFVPDEWDEP